MSHDVVYLDYQATTPMDHRVLQAMSPFWTRCFANPSSAHGLGHQAALALRRARRQVKTSLGVRHDNEIVFTSGATEANHLAIVGAVQGKMTSGRNHIVTTAVEHPSVFAACDRLAAGGCTVTKLPVEPDGRVLASTVAGAITSRTALVSVMYVNNEIGTVQPIPDIAAILRPHGIPLHVDAAQGIGTLDIAIDNLGVDLLTVSAHKIYGPKGVGMLYIRRGTTVSPQYPGSQEHHMRAGTVNLAGVAGLAEALRVLDTERESDNERITRLRDRLESGLLATLPDTRINGSGGYRVPGSLSVTISGVDAVDLIESVPELAISSGSACTSGQEKPSHVLKAIGLCTADARSTIRLGVGRFTRASDIDYAVDRIRAGVARLRASGHPAG